MDQQALREFVLEYASELKDLTFNSKTLINTLTMLAGDNLDAASSVAAAIEQHILTCAPAHKLYALYLVDSIVKNIGSPYTTLFAGNIPKVFMNVWTAAPLAQGSLRKVLNTWKGIFPDAMLAAVLRQIGSPVDVPQQLPYNAAAMPSQAVSASSGGQGIPYPQQPAVLPSVSFQETAGAAQGVRSSQSTILPSTSLPQSLSQYSSSYPQPAKVSAAAPHPRLARSNDPRQRNVAPSSRQPDVPVSQATSHSGTRNGAKHLESLPDISAEELPLKFVDRGKLEFSAERLKAEDPHALRELLACSLALRPKHVDRKFLHRRRMRGKSIMSQQWFVSTDNWIAGTAADVQAAPAFFDIETKESAEQQDVSVPADDSQPVCALSGERFDTFWDDTHEEWRFRDAVRLTAEQAARYGVPPGTIVKVSCLSDSAAPASAAGDSPPAAQSEASEQPPSIKEEPGLEQQEDGASERQGTKREGENSADAQALAKRIKTEPM